VYDKACCVGDLDLKLPASQAQDIVKALRYGSCICVGEGHSAAPWALLQIRAGERCG
jgi:hypothetical protein